MTVDTSEQRGVITRRSSLAAKRALDIGVSAVLLVFLSPVLALIALLILVTDGSPVLFRQTRPGLNGRPFKLVKFRTMRILRSGEDPWSSDAERVTRLGRFLRRSSLDELPELWSVLMGQMSLVGPRPLLEEYLPQYTPRQALRHSVPPGITGLAQISGRRSLTLGQRLELDVRYVEGWSFIGDIWILMKTLVVPFTTGDDPQQSLADIDDVGFLTLKGVDSAPDIDRWEVGSFFHTVALPNESSQWLPEPSLLVATGRQAIAAAFSQGQRDVGWTRLYVPDFYCPDVISWLGRSIDIQTYPCNPLAVTWPQLRPSEAILCVSYFGVAPPLQGAPNGQQIILDVTHDPLAAWIRDTIAAYCIASLRKTLPLPDGAAVWSHIGTPLPDGALLSPPLPAVDRIHEAMNSKARYLRREEIGKSAYLRVHGAAEQGLLEADGIHAVADKTAAYLHRLPAQSYRQDRMRNLEHVEKALKSRDDLVIWPNNFGLIILFADQFARDAARVALAEVGVYSAVLWDPEPEWQGTDSWDFGRRMLHIHTDFRYSTDDMDRVATIINDLPAYLGDKSDASR